MLSQCYDNVKWDSQTPDSHSLTHTYSIHVSSLIITSLAIMIATRHFPTRFDRPARSFYLSFRFTLVVYVRIYFILFFRVYPLVMFHL